MSKKPVTLPKLKAKLQKVFNEYIRLRDSGKPCISCGKIKPLQAGHFYSVRMYDGLRFDELNCHGECARCNLFDDMHLLNYSHNLAGKIGAENFKWLEQTAKLYKQVGRKWSRSEIEDLIELYTEKIKNYEKDTF